MLPATGVPWFPQDYAEQFYLVKCLLGLVSTLMLLYHMNQVWDELIHHSRLGQRLRYITLLAFSVLITGASIEQAHDDIVVSYRNLGGMIVAVLLIVAAGVSIMECRRQKRA